MNLLRRSALLLALVMATLLQTSVQAQEETGESLPLTKSPSINYVTPAPLTFAQQQARFEAEQRTARLEWNRWIGYSPSRPNMNANYMSNGLQAYYIPQRGVMVTTGSSRSWYW